MAVRMRAAGGVCILLLLAGCISTPTLKSEWPSAGTDSDSIELVDTPFHPQQAYQCGPAALATLLGARGNAESPEQLLSATYIPERQGSLQAELVAAGRQRGFIMYRIRPELSDLLRQLLASSPVMILQNQGIRSLPVWHYAVVIGADVKSNRMISRSGTSRRYRESRRTFARRWQLADNWGIVALQPGQLPEDPDWPGYLIAVADLEATGAVEAAELGYVAALGANPGLLAAELGLANVYYQTGRLSQAISHYQVVARDSELGSVALNNLANLLLDLDCSDQARAAIERIDTAQSPHPSAIESTRNRLAAVEPGSQARCRLP